MRQWFFFTSIFVVCAANKEIPDFLHICKSSDPKLIECIINSAESLKPILAKGVEEYTIPSLEPLYIEELISERSAGLHITATKVTVRGASNFFVKDLKLDPETQRYDIDVYLPNLLIECEYGVDGKLLLLPLKGSGPMTANVTDINAKVVLLGELYDVDGEKHIKFYNMTIDTTVGGGTGQLDNLFNGDKVLGDMINQAINKNMDAFLKELLPVIDKNLATVFMQIANSIVSPFSYDQLFPA